MIFVDNVNRVNELKNNHHIATQSLSVALDSINPYPGTPPRFSQSGIFVILLTLRSRIWFDGSGRVIALIRQAWHAVVIVEIGFKGEGPMTGGKSGAEGGGGSRTSFEPLTWILL